MRNPKNLCKKGFVLTIIGLFIGAGFASSMNGREMVGKNIAYEEIIKNGLNQFKDWNGNRFENIRSGQEFIAYKSLLIELEGWYESNPNVSFASLINLTMTIKFKDGYYVILAWFTPSFSNYNREKQMFSTFNLIFGTLIEKNKNCLGTDKKAVILNPFQWQRGNFSFPYIMDYLERTGYTTNDIDYRENAEVNITFIKNGGLSADVIFNKGHGGHIDLDGDGHGETVVVASGEEWTNETGYLYQSDINEMRIIQGYITTNNLTEADYVCYTPSFISYYCKDSLPEDSLVFMATCDSVADYSMAKAFVDGAGAATYVGWEHQIFFWMNGVLSMYAFRLLCDRGFTVEETCRQINFIQSLYHGVSLDYYGDGTLCIPEPYL